MVPNIVKYSNQAALIEQIPPGNRDEKQTDRERRALSEVRFRGLSSFPVKYRRVCETAGRAGVRDVAGLRGLGRRRAGWRCGGDGLGRHPPARIIAACAASSRLLLES
jgi:hypothetical protein